MGLFGDMISEAVQAREAGGVAGRVQRDLRMELSPGVLNPDSAAAIEMFDDAWSPVEQREDMVFPARHCVA